MYDRKLEDEKFLYSKAIVFCLSDYCVVSFAQKKKIKLCRKPKKYFIHIKMLTKTLTDV